tara:strand:+ start:677 stop:1360 length:684 start_codon:yes stop_codon:yes gene_type:complete
MKIAPTIPYPQTVSTTTKSDNPSKSDFSDLLQSRILDQKTSSSFVFQVGVTSDGKPVLSSTPPGYLGGEAGNQRAKRNEMFNIWNEIQSAERSRMMDIESQLGNKMANDLGLSAPFRLSTSWNEYQTGQPLLEANTDFPTVHPQSDKIRAYLDANLKNVPELTGLINGQTKSMAQLQSIGPQKMFEQRMTQNNLDLSDESFKALTAMRDQAQSLAAQAQAELMASFG